MTTVNLLSVLFFKLRNYMNLDPVTRYGLDRPRIESQWGERFSVPVQISPGTHFIGAWVGQAPIKWVPGLSPRGKATRVLH